MFGHSRVRKCFSKKLSCLNFHIEIYSLSGIGFCVWYEMGVENPVDPSTVIEKIPSGAPGWLSR